MKTSKIMKERQTDVSTQEMPPMSLLAKVKTGPPLSIESPAVVADDPVVTAIRPPTGWQLINFRELWQFRDLLYFLTWRDVKVRYKQTLLGASWAVLQPAL